MRIGISLALLVCSATALEGRAAGPLDGDFQVRSAFVVLERGVLQLNAHVQYPVNERIRAALQDGVTLSFDLDLSVSRRRHLWFDAHVVDLTLRRELTYHAVTDRYVVRDETGGEQESMPTLEDALDKLGRIEDLPVAIASQFKGDGPWQVAVRAGVRRGRMSDALRSLMFWSDDWHRTSDWYTWTLTL
jgi:hypothetical protein